MQPRNASHWPENTFADSLGDSLLESLLGLGKRSTFAAGDQLLGQGEISRHVFVLLSGVVKVTATTDQGRTLLLAIRVAGDPVGELAAADGMPRTATVTSCAETSALSIPQPRWQQFLDQNSGAASAITRILSARFRQETERRVEITEQPAPVRIARVLLTFDRSYGRGPQGDRRLPFSLTQSEIAAAADCAVASVQNTLRAMRDRGVVTTGYGWLTVHDSEALAVWPL